MPSSGSTIQRWSASRPPTAPLSSSSKPKPGRALAELLAQDLLGAPVGGADEVARPLDRDLQMLDLAEVAHEVPGGLVGGLHHDV